MVIAVRRRRIATHHAYSWSMTASALAPELTFGTTARTRLLRVVVAAVFVLFFQTYMVAPLIPSLAYAFHADRQHVGLLIPAYTIPYALAALISGAVSDRFGRRWPLFFGMAMVPLTSAAMAMAPNLEALLVLRMISGLTNVGIVVTGLSLVADLFPPNERGRAIGWVFGAIAGGGAFGSTLGGVLAPIISWRGLFILIAFTSVLLFIVAVPLWSRLVATAKPTSRLSIGTLVLGYRDLLRSWRGSRTYLFIFLNAVFHSGVFTWLGVLLHDRFGLGEAGIGLALLGYGVPGLFLGPTIGRVVDRHGRRLIIPAGFLVAAISAAMLAPHWSLALAAVAITVLSLGFDMSHPLLAGIVTMLDDNRRGQAMGFNAFSIFLGMGCGSLIFGGLTSFGMTTALLLFAAMQTLLGLLALVLFQRE